jgi:hypothetical protein
VRSLLVAAVSLVLASAAAACEPSSDPTGPGNTGLAGVLIVYRGATARRTDLPVSAQACVNGVGATHIHPSWRNFEGFALQAVPPDRYEIRLNDVPVGTQVSFRVNDQNWCDVNPTGAVLRNIFANDVALTQNTLTPGQEPGYAFTVTQAGMVAQ